VSGPGRVAANGNCVAIHMADRYNDPVPLTTAVARAFAARVLAAADSVDHSGVAGEPEATSRKASETPTTLPLDARTYEDGLVDGANMVSESITDGLTNEALAEADRLHSLLHPAQADAGVHESTRNPAGCDRAWCTSILPEMLYAERVIRADERRAGRALLGPQIVADVSLTPVHPDAASDSAAAVLAGGVVVSDEVVTRIAADVYDNVDCEHRVCWTRATVDRAAPLIAAQALRAMAMRFDDCGDEIKTYEPTAVRGGFSVAGSFAVGMAWKGAARELRKRADELERRADRG